MPVAAPNPYFKPVIPSRYRALILSHNPAVYYRFESGLLGIDETDNNNNAVTVTDVSEVAGEIGGGASFNNSTSGLITPPDTSINNIASSSYAYTIEAWMNVSSHGSVRMYTAKHDDSLTDGGFETYLDSTGYVYIRRYWSSNGDIWRTNAALPTGQWVHVVAVMRVDTTATTYFNGVAQGMTRTQTGSGVTEDDSGGDLYIGHREFGAAYNFNGLLDEVAIYRRELTTDEITEHYVTGISSIK